MAGLQRKAKECKPKSENSKLHKVFQNLIAKNKPELNKKEPQSVSETLDTFCHQCSVSGIQKIVLNKEKPFIRTFWIIVLCIALMAHTYHLYQVISQYLEFGSTEIVQNHFEAPVFPSVTVCNTNPYSTEQELQTLYDSLKFKDTTDKLHKNLSDDYTKIYEFSKSRIFSGSLIYGNRISIPKGIGNLSKIALIPKCYYGGMKCSWGRFLSFSSPHFFRCYTFSADQTVLEPGPNSGLSLELYLGNKQNPNVDFTTPSFGGSKGAVIDVHATGTLPTPFLSGISIAPGYSTQIIIQQHDISKLGHPYSPCTSRKEVPSLNKRTYKYSLKACYGFCKLMYVYQQCACVISDVPMPDELAANGTNYCANFEDISEFYKRILCEYNALQSFSTSKCGNGELPTCTEPCAYTTYEVLNSNFVWPVDDSFLKTDEYSKHEIHRHLATEQNTLNSTARERHDVIRASFARVNIYFKRLVVTKHIESKAMTLWDLLANLGGSFGLWAGLSLTAVWEFVCLPFQLAHAWYYSRHGRRKLKRADEETPLESEI